MGNAKQAKGTERKKRPGAKPALKDLAPSARRARGVKGGIWVQKPAQTTSPTSTRGLGVIEENN